MDINERVYVWDDATNDIKKVKVRDDNGHVIDTVDVIGTVVESHFSGFVRIDLATYPDTMVHEPVDNLYLVGSGPVWSIIMDDCEMA